MLAARLATFNLTLLSPTTLAPPPVLVMLPHAAGVKIAVKFCRVSPLGKLSGNCTPVNAPGLAAGLLTPNVIVVAPPGVMVPPMLLLAVGGAYTFTVALAASALLPALVCKAPMECC